MKGGWRAGIEGQLLVIEGMLWTDEILHCLHSVIPDDPFSSAT